MRPFSIILATVVLAACSAGNVARDATPTATIHYTPEPTTTPKTTPVPTASAAPTPNWTAAPVIANDAASLATQFVMVEALIHEPNATAEQLAWAGHAEQLDISRLADYPEWTDQVLAAMPATPKATISAAIEAGKQLRQLHAGPIPKNLPDWHIVQPPPIAELMGYYKEAESTFGVPWYFLASINLI